MTYFVSIGTKNLNAISISLQIDKLNHASTSSLNFLQARCSSWRPTTSVNQALKARALSTQLINNSHIILSWSQYGGDYTEVTTLMGSEYQVENHYRQHCAQRKAPVFKLLRDRFWVVLMGVKFGMEEWTAPYQISPHPCNDKDRMTTKTENFTEILPNFGISRARFSRNLQSLYHVSGCVRGDASV